MSKSVPASDREVKVGDNSPSGVAAEQLRSIVERIERLHEERNAISDDVRDVYSEARGNGFNPKIIKQVIALRRRDQAELREEAAILDLYLSALGMGPKEDE